SGGVGEVAAHEGVVETELVGEDDGLAVLLERLGPIAVHGVHRHGEVAQPHSRLRARRSPTIGPPKRVMWPNLSAAHKHQFVAGDMRLNEVNELRLADLL